MLRIILLLIISFFFIFPPRAQAIIFLPALILIPIAKIIALLMGGLSLPAIGMGALYSKLFKKSLRQTVLIAIFLLIGCILFLALLIKIENPSRPIL